MKDVFARSSVYPFILWSSPFLAVECFCFLSSRSSLLCSFFLSSSVCSFNSRRPQNTVSLTPHYIVHRSKVALGTKTNSSPPHRASLLTELPKREAKRGLSRLQRRPRRFSLLRHMEYSVAVLASLLPSCKWLGWRVEAQN